MVLDTHPGPVLPFENLLVDVVQEFLNLEEFQMPETAVYEPAMQNDYDRPVCRSR